MPDPVARLLEVARKVTWENGFDQPECEVLARLARIVSAPTDAELALFRSEMGFTFNTKINKVLRLLARLAVDGAK